MCNVDSRNDKPAIESIFVFFFILIFLINLFNQFVFGNCLSTHNQPITGLHFVQQLSYSTGTPVSLQYRSQNVRHQFPVSVSLRRGRLAMKKIVCRLRAIISQHLFILHTYRHEPRLKQKRK